MKERIAILSAIILSSLFITGCKSEYERIRQSNDPALMYQKGLELYEAEEYEKAQVLLEQSISAYRGQKEAEELFFKYAYTHFYLKQYILSAHYFQNFANTFINSEYREEAEFMAAYSNVQNSPSFRLDQEYTNKAIDGLQQFVNTYPQSDRVSECNELIDELRQKLERKLFEEGRLYYNLTEYQSADRSFSNLLKTFPETQNGEEIRYLMVLSAFNLAKNSVYEKRGPRYDETIERVEQFIKKYPESRRKREVLEIKNLAAQAKNELKS